MPSMYVQLTDNFNSYEFRCLGEDCCDHSAPISERLVQKIQVIRTYFDIRIDVSNGYRCFTHNASISKPTSQHCRGLAADIYFPKNTNRAEFIDKCKEIFNGIGVYETFLHVDIRHGRKALWYGT